MRLMSEEDVVAREWGTEIEAEGGLMSKVCELNVEILALVHAAPASYQ